VNGLKVAILGILEGLKRLLQLIAKYGNTPITISIFSGLFKYFVGKDLPTFPFFELISLSLAIPATIVTKLILGIAPPEIPHLDARLLGALAFGGDDSVAVLSFPEPCSGGRSNSSNF
jgi:hypothetical protein